MQEHPGLCPRRAKLGIPAATSTTRASSTRLTRGSATLLSVTQTWTPWTAVLAWGEGLVDWTAQYGHTVPIDESAAQVMVLLGHVIGAEAGGEPTHPEDPRLINLDLLTLYVDRLDRARAAHDLARPSGPTPALEEPGSDSYHYIRALDPDSHAWHDLISQARRVLRDHLSGQGRSALAEPVRLGARIQSIAAAYEPNQRRNAQDSGDWETTATQPLLYRLRRDEPDLDDP